MLHKLLTQYRDDLVARCARKLQARHPTRPPDEVLDTIPWFIDEVIKAERREGGIPEQTPLPAAPPQAREHGEQRFRHGFRISEIAMDFGAISDSIGEIAIEHDFHLDPRSYKLLNACLDAAIAAALEEYFALERRTQAQGVAEWVGFLGHELRNSIASAILAFDAIKTGHVGIGSQTARVLDRSLHRVEALVAQTLAAVQLRVGKTIEPQPIRLRQLIDDIISGSLVERDITVDIEVEPSLVVAGDENLLESALTNLIQNALKFTRAGGRVVVRAVEATPATTIEIEDECGGLGSDDPESLFGAFVQGSKRDRGVGLGLAITQQAIEAHAGQISVADRAPKGCVFTVRLPHPPTSLR